MMRLSSRAILVELLSVVASVQFNYKDIQTTAMIYDKLMEMGYTLTDTECVDCINHFHEYGRKSTKLVCDRQLTATDPNFRCTFAFSEISYNCLCRTYGGTSCGQLQQGSTGFVEYDEQEGKTYASERVNCDDLVRLGDTDPFRLADLFIERELARPVGVNTGLNSGAGGSSVKVKSKIMGGQKLAQTEFRWLVHIDMEYIGWLASPAFSSKLTCSGYMLNDRWVLTSKVCIPQGVVKLPFFKATAVWNDDFSSKKYPVIRHIQHKMANLALLELSEPMPAVNFLCPYSGFDQQTTVIAFGYGYSLDFDGKIKLGKARAIQQQVLQCRPFGSNEEVFYIATPNTTCGGVVPGDYGGPVARKVGANYELVGIISTRRIVNCNNKLHKAIEVISVSAFRDWIVTAIRRKMDTSTYPEPDDQ